MSGFNRALRQPRTTRVREGVYRPRTRIRDKGGVPREVTATGTTVAAAERALREKLLDRATPTQQAITADTTIASPAPGVRDVPGGDDEQLSGRSSKQVTVPGRFATASSCATPPRTAPVEGPSAAPRRRRTHQPTRPRAARRSRAGAARGRCRRGRRPPVVRRRRDHPPSVSDDFSMTAQISRIVSRESERKPPDH
jgi:hypothetical protein